MSKKWIVSVSAGGLALMSAWAFAGREELEFYVSVDIPSQQFYVTPSEPDWIHREQVLIWDVNTESLSTFRRNFDVKNDGGAIEARLESRAALSRASDPHYSIFLRVHFNGRELRHDLSTTEVVSAEDARAGARVPLEIRPVVPFDGLRPGDYYGNVNIMFNAVAPPG